MHEKLNQWVARHDREPGAAPAPSWRDGPSVERVRQLPAAWADGVRSFYDALHAEPGCPDVCHGTACSFPDGHAPASSFPAGRIVRCLGRCAEAPVHGHGESRPIARRSLLEPAAVLRHLVGEGPTDWATEYALPDGEAILGAVAASSLRGRGGAAFPTAVKWRAARETPAPDRFLIANGDEGDPGAYIDRLLLEEAPHAVLAGVVAAARAIGARQAVVFVRHEYPRAQERLRTALAEAEANAWLSGTSVTVVSGGGSYVAGEETALLASLMGLRAEPWPKPPYPAQRGLFGLPTVVQNIETLALVPWLVRTGRPANMKALSLSGAVPWRGGLEVPFGVTLAEVLAAAGGPLPGRPWRMALVGGPMGRLIPAAHFAGTRLAYDTLPGLGHGGIVVLDESVTARALFEHLAEFARSESCGNCTPCRVGCAQLLNCRDTASLERLLRTLELGSACGFGQGVPKPISDLLAAFPGEVLP